MKEHIPEELNRGAKLISGQKERNPLLQEIIDETHNMNYFTAYKKAKLLRNSTDYKTLTNKDKIAFLIYETMGIDNSNDYSEVPSSLGELAKLLRNSELKADERFAINQILLIQSTSTNLKIDDTTIVECEQFLSSIDVNELIGKDNNTLAVMAGYFLFYKSVAYAKLKQWNDSYNALKRGLDLVLLMKSSFFIFQAYYLLAEFYTWKGNEYEKATDEINKAIDYFISVKDYKYLMSSYSHMASTYVEKLNNLQKGLEVINKSLVYVSVINAKSEGNLSAICGSSIKKVNILAKMGKYEESIKFYNEMLHFVKEKEKFDDGFALALWNINIAEIYEEMGEFNKVKDHLDNGFNILTKSKFYFIGLLSEYYYQFIKVDIKLGYFDKAEEKFQNFTEFMVEFNKHKNFESRNYYEYIRDITAQYKLTQAMMLIIKQTISGNSQAQVYLEEIVMDTQTKNELLIKALILLINLLFQEYKLFEKKEIIEKITLFSNQLNHLANAYNSIPLKIQVLILQAKLEITTGNLEHYERLLKMAMEYAIEYNLSDQEEIIERELADFNKELNKWENILSTPLRDRLVKIELEDYIKKMSQLLNE